MHSVAFPSFTLSKRTPQELIDMKFPESDIYMADGLFAKGQRSVILGPGGVGKSMFIGQLVISFILGKPFLGFQSNCRGKRCLILQAENSNRRLSVQFARQLSKLTPEEQATFSEHCFIHTIETTGDAKLRLNDGSSALAISKLLNDTGADIVIVDPLNAFAKSSLNSDDGMQATLETLEELVRQSNPEASLIVVHHTLTGAKAQLDAVGPNRASYGRGSSVLHAWSRGTINIAEGLKQEDGPKRIVVGCGKNSNGTEFEPFGAILDPTTLTFQVDPEFNLAAWKNGMSSGSTSHFEITPEQVAAFATDPVEGPKLISLLMGAYRCKQAKAYAAVKAAKDRTLIKRGRYYQGVQLSKN